MTAQIVFGLLTRDTGARLSALVPQFPLFPQEVPRMAAIQTIQMKVRPEDLTSIPQGSEKIPDPVILTIFGASCDLTRR